MSSAPEDSSSIAEVERRGVKLPNSVLMGAFGDMAGDMAGEAEGDGGARWPLALGPAVEAGGAEAAAAAGRGTAAARYVLPGTVRFSCGGEAHRPSALQAHSPQCQRSTASTH
jgi:hypothetical protein